MFTELSRVTYLFFNHELAGGEGGAPGGEHTLDREVRLESSDGSTLHVSWTSSPVQYCLGVQEQSWFTPGDAAEVDVTTREPWRSLVGGPIEFLWQEPEHQVLELRGKGSSVFLSSREGKNWCADVVTISDSRPELPSNTSLERTRAR